MIVFLYLGPAAFVVALAIALGFASTARRYALLLLGGLALDAGWFALILLTASTDPSRPDCSDCSYVWGRWWWPPLVVSLLGANLLGWLLGATAGWFVRRALRRRRP